MDTPSSDTPETDADLDPELRGPQGPADWAHEPRSDDLFSESAKQRLAELVEHLERG